MTQIALDLPVYNMTASNENDPDRKDDDIWRLVGMQAVVIQFRQTINSFDAWARTVEEHKILEELWHNLVIIERNTYDRFAKTYYRPRVEYETFCQPVEERQAQLAAV